MLRGVGDVRGEPCGHVVEYPVAGFVGNIVVRVRGLIAIVRSSPSATGPWLAFGGHSTDEAGGVRVGQVDDIALGAVRLVGSARRAAHGGPACLSPTPWERDRRARADFRARPCIYALRACSARRRRSAGSNTPSGSTCRSNRSKKADRAGDVRAAGSSVLAQLVCEAMRARNDRCSGVRGAVVNGWLPF
jgi:hypothetical protein